MLAQVLVFHYCGLSLTNRGTEMARKKKPKLPPRPKPVTPDDPMTCSFRIEKKYWDALEQSALTAGLPKAEVLRTALQNEYTRILKESL